MTDASGGDQTIEVTDDRGGERYVITVDGEPAGFAQYRDRGRTIAFVHTEIDDRFEGRGLGGRLVSAALDDARSRGLAVLPFCPFVRGYIERHPDYLDLVPATQREQFGL
ncbi:MAG: N-acetyltransferase [Actinobacteria bacterium]|nr:N-acetyltransferase [Actinomycetota bacterium]